MRDRHLARLRGFTLIEVVLSMSVMTVLMGGLATAVVLAGRAIPDGRSSAAAALEGHRASEQIMSELFCAQTVTMRTSTKIAFTVADRDQDGNLESILYDWSGTPGGALLRTYNGGTPRVVADDVQEFDLAYGVNTETTTTTETQTITGTEILLASFDGWAGVTPETRTHVIGPGYWDSEYFVVVPPAGSTELLFTRAVVVLMHAGTPPNGVTVGIHRSKNDGTYDPAPMPIASPAAVPGASLSTMPLWVNVTLSGMKVTDPDRTDYCLVVKGNEPILAYLQHHYNRNAPDNGMVHRWTSDSGASWDPRSNQSDQQDMRFYVYGSFVSTSSQPVETTRQFLTWITIALRIGSDSPVDVRTSVRILNEPELPTL